MLPRWIIALVFALIGLIVGFCIDGFLHRPVLTNNQREIEGDYRFINPLLSCGDAQFSTLQNDRANALRSDLEDLVRILKEQGKITDAGIYFRELQDGPVVGVNETAMFTPGSLLKVPLAISAYKIAETNPAFMQKAAVYSGTGGSLEQHFPSPPMQSGKTYDVEALVRETLVDSNNDAAYLLGGLVGEDSLDDSYSHLGIKAPTLGSDYATSVRTYASFFRTLYNATYLSHSASEHLLSILSESAFHQGIVAGVPEGVVVAHKFGERALDDSSTVQLHDCGIVYHPDQPYVLCVMLRGNSFDNLAQALGGISRLAYSYAE